MYFLARVWGLKHKRFLLVLLLVCCQCSRARPVSNPSAELLKSGAPQTLIFSDTFKKKPALDLKVLEDYLDGDALVLRLLLSAHVQINLAQLSLKVGLLNNQGEAVAERLFFLEEMKASEGEDILRANEERQLVLNIPQPKNLSASDYQIEIYWGEESDALRRMLQGATAHGAKGKSDLLISAMRVETSRVACTSSTPEACPFRQTLFLQLENTGNLLISSAVLGLVYSPKIKFMDLKHAQQRKKERSETSGQTRMEIANLNLAVGQKRQVKLVLDQDLSPDFLERFRPEISVLEFH